MRATALTYEAYTAYEAAPAVKKEAHYAKKAALACAAPFIGLAFVIGLPVIGPAVLAWMAAKAFVAAYPKAARALRNVALFAAAPFIGLAYAAALPFVGIAALAWVGVRAAVKGNA
ncbi:MAG TPA: hypothetical protein VFR66_05620 [Burkholderiales bacterium]|nr:hypothetical protein [Burkholderiales bacterium]